MGLKAELLGRVAIAVPGAPPVEVRGRQPALVLAHLVLERPRPLLRDELIDLLWPGPLPDHWEGAARQVVSRARRALVEAGLPPEALVSSGGTARLVVDEPVEVDVEVALSQVVEAGGLADEEEWDRATAVAEAALTRLQLPFLPQVDCAWAGGWRDRLHSFAQRASHVAISAAIGSQRSEQAIELARDAVEHDRFDEHATRLLMAAFERAGNRPGALQAYEQLRRLLDDELGVRPSEETEEAHRALLGAQPLSPRGDTRLRTAVRAVDTGPFVGRRDELATFADRRARALAGTCQIVVVEGEAGIGKTRLVLEEADAAHECGGLVLWGRCDPDVGVAHGPFADVISQLLSDRPDVIDSMGVLATHLAPLVPQLVPEPSEAMPSSSDQASRRRPADDRRRRRPLGRRRHAGAAPARRPAPRGPSVHGGVGAALADARRHPG